ncbi:hypothetical protein Q8W15_16725 [Photobacterium damselae subsp. piscicida]|uniref:Uncharacterized protein n=1 Tax=Photobacterium damsela subsp. piscicida TaxID=38294 RepID=A0A1V1VHX0_PHODP|nr:hypothetical protein [Photobacterium damselae]MBE8127857.1 hypothetical protein [Photobacterium damselae subsp. piscicida]MDP2534182.1 hypothetical protein [Photobacterium damselae subsp. piscicida]MDP2558481.1 hypothetical protein [Photobacterium damselae subsp. piscicida]MDP2568527.1 hypothetical protein [Photobacterium damselae subsp. piscicida]MDP2568541.1 hypothetical protein [Photobacterium damselae subsp. piscicida]
MRCIFPGCHNQATNNLSVRLRREDTSAIWAPNTNAYLCHDHASSGFDVYVVLRPTTGNQITTIVSVDGGDPATRTTSINHRP